MKFNDTLMNDCTNPALQTAFRTYYGELGVKVTNWDGLFEEIGEGEDEILVRWNEKGEIVGFLMLVTSEAVTAWRGFFSTKLGCVEEFWIAPAYRRQGHGSALLKLAEEHLAAQGCGYTILTTDTAPDFYRRHGYTHQAGIRAKNTADVYVKPLVK